MKVVYGGTFDPVHEGHLAIARAVAEVLGAPVSLLPSADPPHRPAPGASARHRARMLELATAGDPMLSIDLRELDRPGPSFTYDTLAQLRQEIGPSEPMVWVLGLDSMAQLDSWHNWRRLSGLAHLLAVQRPGTSVEIGWLRNRAPRVHAHFAPRERAAGELQTRPCGFYAVLPMDPLRPESGTQVRQRLAAGLSLEEVVPPAVASYIQQQGLYRPAPGS